MKELWDSLGEIGQLAVGLGSIVAIMGVFKLFNWAMEKIDD